MSKIFSLLSVLCILTMLIACGGSDTTVVDPTPDPPEVSTEFRVALSVSPFAEILFNANQQYSDGNTTASSVQQLAELYKNNGGNEIFARMSTEKSKSAIGEDRSLTQGVARADLARFLNLPLNPELGLFGTYGDGSCQTQPDFSEYPEIVVPGPWETLTVEQMLPILEQYGAIAAQTILDTGVEINYWDIGNEIGFGTAGVAPQPLPGSLCDTLEETSDWYRAPDGVDPIIGTESVLSLRMMTEAERITWLKEHVWPHEARILAAVATGIKSVDADAKFSTHIGYGLGQDFAVEFFQMMINGGFDLAEAGFSFYPSAAPAEEGQFNKLKNTIVAVHTSLNLPVFIAEFSYPSEPMTIGPYANWNFDVPGYSLSEEGQANLLEDLTRWGVANGVSGIRPWAPEVNVDHWIPMALFTPSGDAKPALFAMSKALE